LPSCLSARGLWCWRPNPARSLGLPVVGRGGVWVPVPSLSFDMGAWAPCRSVPCACASVSNDTSALGSLCFRVVRHGGVGLPYAFALFDMTALGSPSLRVIRHVALGPRHPPLACFVGTSPPAGHVLSLSVLLPSGGLVLVTWAGVVVVGSMGSQSGGGIRKEELEKSSHSTVARLL